MEETDSDTVQRVAVAAAKKMKDSQANPTYRATCCGDTSFTIDHEGKIYICTHCNTQYKLDIDRWIKE